MTSVAAFLLNVHVQVNEVDEEGWSPLIHACVLGKTQAALTLLDNGAQIDLKVNQIGFLIESIISLSHYEQSLVECNNNQSKLQL